MTTNVTVTGTTTTVTDDGTTVTVGLAAATVPTPHASTHESGGSDELTLATSSVTGLDAALAGKADIPAAWSSYTCTLGGGWAIGDGTITAAWCQVGKLVFFRIRVNMGSTTTFGASAPTLTLPTGFRTGLNAPWAISGRMYDASTAAQYLASWQPTSATVIQMNTVGTVGLQGAITSTVPFTWASGDDIFSYGFYEAA